jgi:HD-like signal output (HDOD) protein
MVACVFCNEPAPDHLSGGDPLVLAACPACMNPYFIDAEAGEVRRVGGAADVRQIAAKGTIGGELIAALPRAIENLPVLPEVSTRVMELLRNPETSMQDIAETVKQDQAIAVKVLQLANSAMYGGLTTITELNAACARLGVRTIANAVQAVANGNLYITSNPAYKDRMRRMWRHSVATGYAASEIAVLTASPRSDALFVAGLIHDIGSVALLDIISNTRRGVLVELHASAELLSEVLNSYSTLAGLHVVQGWKLPPEFAMTTYFCRTPDSVPTEDIRTMTHIVCLAGAVADTSGFSVNEGATSLLSHPSTKYLGLSDIKLAILRADLEDAVQPLLEIAATG